MDSSELESMDLVPHSIRIIMMGVIIMYCILFAIGIPANIYVLLRMRQLARSDTFGKWKSGARLKSKGKVSLSKGRSLGRNMSEVSHGKSWSTKRGWTRRLLYCERYGSVLPLHYRKHIAKFCDIWKAQWVWAHVCSLDKYIHKILAENRAKIGFWRKLNSRLHLTGKALTPWAINKQKMRYQSTRYPSTSPEEISSSIKGIFAALTRSATAMGRESHCAPWRPLTSALFFSSVLRISTMWAFYIESCIHLINFSINYIIHSLKKINQSIPKKKISA